MIGDRAKRKGEEIGQKSRKARVEGEEGSMSVKELCNSNWKSNADGVRATNKK